MFLGLFRRDSIQSEDPKTIGAAVADQFQRDHAAVQTWSEVEHDDDGRHTAITAKSLKVSGDATIGGQMQSATIKPPINLGPSSQFPILINGPVPPADTVTDYNSPPGVVVTADVQKALLTSGVDLVPAQDDTWNLGLDGQTVGLLKRRWRGLVVSRTVRGNDLWAGNRFWEQNRAQALGYWTPVAFNAANYSADPPIVWTVAAGNQFRYAYTLIGKTMTLAVITSGGVVSAGPPASGLYLRVTIPGGFLPAGNAVAMGSGATASQFTFVQAQAVAGRSYIGIQPLSGAQTWQLGGVDAFFTIIFEIQ